MKADDVYQACRCSRLPGIVIGIMVACCLAESRAEQPASAPSDNATHEQIGHASWYGPGFHGKKTASGKKFDQGGLTAAHPTLPLGTRVEVINLDNNKKIDVEITDRGPHDGKRAIDISAQAAKKLDMKKKGTAKVKIKSQKTASKEKNPAVEKMLTPHKQSRAGSSPGTATDSPAPGR